MLILSPSQTANALQYPALIASISSVFAGGATAPQRHHHTISKAGEPDAVLLIMPAWAEGFGVGGVKIVNITPGNATRGLASIAASYLVFDELTGEHKAILDGATLTAMRTAAVSALAADKLAKKDSRTLLIVGAGRVAQELTPAFCAVRPIDEVLVWSRSAASANALVSKISASGMSAKHVSDLEAGIKQADIISCATLATDPLIQGKWLHAGQHVDLIGSYAPHMREADDEAIRRALVYIDTNAALHETGDLIAPIKSGALLETSIRGTLYDICTDSFTFNRMPSDITLFKGVGHALEDLAAASLALRRIG